MHQDCCIPLNVGGVGGDRRINLIVKLIDDGCWVWMVLLGCGYEYGFNTVEGGRGGCLEDR